MKEKMDSLEARKEELTTRLASVDDAAAPVHLHPSIAQIYRQKVTDLTASLNDDLARPEAMEALRDLVSEVRMVPDDGDEHGHVMELYGELGAILGLADNGNDKPRRVTGEVSVSMVAGGRTHLYLPKDGRPMGPADVGHVAKQVEVVAGNCAGLQSLLRSAA